MPLEFFFGCFVVLHPLHNFQQAIMYIYSVKFQCQSLFYYSKFSLQAILAPHHDTVVAAVLSDVENVLRTLTSSHPPLLPHTPPTACRLLWLHSLGERASSGMDVLRSVAPQLLEGEMGWKLRHIYSDFTDKLKWFVLKV